MTNKVLTVVKIGVGILFIVALVMVGWLVYTRILGVGGGKEEVELTWWVLWEEAEDVQVLADAYEAENPNVKINIEVQNKTSYREKVIRKLTYGTTEETPDIIRVHNTWIPLLQSQLYPLPTSVMSEGVFSETFYDTASNDLKGTDGKIYAIPIMFDGLGLYYNKDLLKEAGYQAPETTWDDLRIQAQAVTEYDKDGNIRIAGIGMGTSNNIDFAFDIVNLLILQEGVEMVDSTGKTTFAKDPEMKAAKALKYYVDMSTRYKVWDRGLPRDITMFAEGRLAMMFAPSWRVHDINDAIEGAGAKLNYDVVEVPQQPSEEGEKVNWSIYWAETVSKKSKNPETAWDFLKFVTEQEQLRTFYSKCREKREFGEIYPRKDMAEEIIGEKYVSAYIKMADSATTWRMIDDEKVSLEFAALIEDAVKVEGYSISGYHNKLEEMSAVIDEFTMIKNY